MVELEDARWNSKKTPECPITSYQNPKCDQSCDGIDVIIDTTIFPGGRKDIGIQLSNITTFLMQDFLSQISEFFQNPFNLEAYPNPHYSKSIEDKAAPSTKIQFRANNVALVVLGELAGEESRVLMIPCTTI